MDKYERLEKTLSGERTDRAPVALWRYWPGDDQRAADFAHNIVQFQTTYDWDFVTVAPSSSFSVVDYGLTDEWQGALDGTRTIQRAIISRSLEWTELRPLDPSRGTLARQLEALRLICDALEPQRTPIVQMLWSPLAQARLLSGEALLLRHLRTQPDRLQTALNALTETMLRLIEALKKYPIAGLFYSNPVASYDWLSETEYQTFGLPYDRKILEALPQRWWLNMLHLPSNAPVFRPCSQLPVQAINWHDQQNEPDLAQAKLIFNGAAYGGLSASSQLQNSTPSALRDSVKKALAAVNNRRLIIGANDAAPISTPLSHFRAVRQAVETTGVG